MSLKNRLAALEQRTGPALIGPSVMTPEEWDKLVREGKPLPDGVFVLPAVMSEAEWCEVAAKQQAELLLRK